MNLKIDLGNPDEDYKNEKGNTRICLQYKKIWNSM